MQILSLNLNLTLKTNPNDIMSVWWLKTSIYRQILLLLHVYHPSPKTCNGLSHLISTPLSLCWGYMFLKSIPWRIALSKTWTSEELQSQKPEPLKNCSLKNQNPWGIAASKTWTPEDSSLKNLNPLRNSSFKNLKPWIIPVFKILTLEEFQPQVVSQPLRNSILLSFRLSTVYQPFIFRF